MTPENGKGLGEPIISPATAKLLLVNTGRAIERQGGGIDVDVDKLDSVGLAALQIHLSGESGTLSHKMEEITGESHVWTSDKLGELVMISVCPHAPAETGSK